MELGKYRAVDAETKSIIANFDIKANGSVAKMKIDITDVNAKSIRSEKGAEVYVAIDVLGDEAVTYLLKKVN